MKKLIKQTEDFLKKGIEYGQDFITPGKEGSCETFVNNMLGLFDGPEQRELQAAIKENRKRVKPLQRFDQAKYAEDDLEENDKGDWVKYSDVQRYLRARGIK